MLEWLQLSALVSAGLFAGAALYINVAEHPARMRLDAAAALRQWAPSYRRATWMQAPLALVSCACGVAVWIADAQATWLIAAVSIGAVVPFTFLAIMPTNHRLLAADLDPGSAECRALLAKWGVLHAVRTALSLVATLTYGVLVYFAAR